MSVIACLQQLAIPHCSKATNSCIAASNVLGVPGWADFGTREGVEPATTNSQGHLLPASAAGLRGATAAVGPPRGRATANPLLLLRFSVKLVVNQRYRPDLKLVVGAVPQTVEVFSDATGSTQLGDLIETKKMTRLPLNGRSFIDLMGLDFENFESAFSAPYRPVFVRSEIRNAFAMAVVHS
jgi:hypothetical protein